MWIKKRLLSILLALCLVFALAYTQDTKCLAQDQPTKLMIYSTQLESLESNNQKLQDINKMRLWELVELKRQALILQTELGSSKTALEQAQKSLSKMQLSTDKLESKINKLRTNKVAPVIAYGTKAGFMAGLRFKVNDHYDVSVIGNSKSFVMSTAYNF